MVINYEACPADEKFPQKVNDQNASQRGENKERCAG